MFLVWYLLQTLALGTRRCQEPACINRKSSRWQRMVDSTCKSYEPRRQIFVKSCLNDPRVATHIVVYYHHIEWQRFIAFFLASYSLFAIGIDIQSIPFLPREEKDAGTNYEEDEWGCGQILATFVSVPVFVEYFYLIFS